MVHAADTCAANQSGSPPPTRCERFRSDASSHGAPSLVAPSQGWPSLAFTAAHSPEVHARTPGTTAPLLPIDTISPVRMRTTQESAGSGPPPTPHERTTLRPLHSATASTTVPTKLGQPDGQGSDVTAHLPLVSDVPQPVAASARIPSHRETGRMDGAAASDVPLPDAEKHAVRTAACAS